MSARGLILALGCFCFSSMWADTAEEIARGGVYSVIEIPFTGPECGPADSPARDYDFQVHFQHESGQPDIRVMGFWDGDGQGGIRGNVFKVRFCPTQKGRWTLRRVQFGPAEWNGPREGDFVTALPSDHPGFWLVDTENAGGRWYKRSDGSHPYIVGNTHYSFLSGYQWNNEPSRNDIRRDILGNAEYFKKLRFGLHGDLYPHPEEKPFFDDQGKPTDSGDFSHRPNPAWFHNRVDTAVQAAFERDLIADLILAGPDTEASRSTLRAGANGNDPAPFLSYIAARYGSYPNVWFCLCNEYNIRVPVYTEEQIARFGQVLRQSLPHPSPISVHASPPIYWSDRFDLLPPWNDHQIIQEKLRRLPDAADFIETTYNNPNGKEPRRKPTINDELSYQGEGDEHNEGDTVESLFGAFLGGGYGTTSEKSGNKIGQYFAGNFDPETHSAADNLRWMRRVIDSGVTFWKMAPDRSLFSSLRDDFRGLAWPDHEYVLGTNREQKGITAHLPQGSWTVTRYDLIRQESSVLSDKAEGSFVFDSPESRAVLFHFEKH